MNKKTQYWLCKEGTEEFVMEGKKEDVSFNIQMWNGVIVRELFNVKTDYDRFGKVKYSYQ